MIHSPYLKNELVKGQRWIEKVHSACLDRQLQQDCTSLFNGQAIQSQRSKTCNQQLHKNIELSMLSLYPYLLGTTWVFDDERTGLKEEAFVLGMSEMISRIVEKKGIPNAAQGFAMTFSDQPFDGHDVELTWLRSDDTQVVPGADGSASQYWGNWYMGEVAGLQMEGWLCPALGLYFPAAPKKIFVRAEQLPAGINPVWEIASGDGRQRRFVSASKE